MQNIHIPIFITCTQKIDNLFLVFYQLTIFFIYNNCGCSSSNNNCGCSSIAKLKMFACFIAPATKYSSFHILWALWHYCVLVCLLLFSTKNLSFLWHFLIHSFLIRGFLGKEKNINISPLSFAFFELFLQTATLQTFPPVI